MQLGSSVKGSTNGNPPARKTAWLYDAFSWYSSEDGSVSEALTSGVIPMTGRRAPCPLPRCLSTDSPSRTRSPIVELAPRCPGRSKDRKRLPHRWLPPTPPAECWRLQSRRSPPPAPRFASRSSASLRARSEQRLHSWCEWEKSALNPHRRLRRVRAELSGPPQPSHTAIPASVDSVPRS